MNRKWEVVEDWNEISMILTRNGICQTFDTNKKSKTKTRKGDICGKISESINLYLSYLSNRPFSFIKLSYVITNRFSWYLSKSSRKWLNKVVKFYLSWNSFTLALVMSVTNSTCDTKHCQRHYGPRRWLLWPVSLVW